MKNIMVGRAVLALGAAALISADMVHAGGFSDYAKVVDVVPMTQTVRVAQPRQECWNEQVVHRAGANNTGGMILGGAIGAALGNRVGKGNGNKAAIAVGTLLGAGIGQNMGRERGHSYTTNEQHCQVVNDYYEEEQVTGYRVSYRYKGHTYYTHTDHHPGDRIPIRVSVTPAF